MQIDLEPNRHVRCENSTERCGAHLEHTGVSELLDHQLTRPSSRTLLVVGLDTLDVVGFRLLQLRHQIVQLPAFFTCCFIHGV